MTLKGKRNHYNVKFLSGYGLSISLRNNKIVLRNGKDPFSDTQDIEEWFITNLPYEKIVISGRGYLSTEAISLLCNNYKNIVITNSYGKPVSLINGLMDSMTASRYRMAQYDAFRDEAKRHHLAKMTVLEKLDSQIRFLKMLDREDVNQTISVLNRNKQRIQEGFDIYKTEATSGNVYFRYYAKLFDPKYKFESRNQSALRITKRNASDVINGLLNYGYAVLAGEISKFVNGFGLDAYYGFMHRSHTGFQPLVYDLMEPFRWLVEYSVWKLANTKSNQKILQKEYAFTRRGTVVMDERLIRRFLELLERTFSRERRYDYRHGAKTKDGLKSVQEITVVKVAVQNLADFCLERQKGLESTLF